MNAAAETGAQERGLAPSCVGEGAHKPGQRLLPPPASPQLPLDTAEPGSATVPGKAAWSLGV